LTKKHEQFINGRLGQAPAMDGELLGEVTVVVGPALVQAATGEAEVLGLARTMIGEGMRPKDAARAVRERTRGWTVKRIYELILEQDAE
jgi:16S rRNA (cytidine1402-2'-O)-methyltransferase